jgi:hypothetical protein
MLAALIATRGIAPPPPPPVIFYGNQYVAATTTFGCLALIKQFAALSTSQRISQTLLFSLSGREAIIDQLNRVYVAIISSSASDDPNYLSVNISQSIAILTTLTNLVQSIPFAPQNVLVFLHAQNQLALSIRILQSLAIPPGVLAFS